MGTTSQSFPIDCEIRKRLVARLAKHAEVITFEDDPALASLCSSLGLHFEIGHPDYDRLSPFFGVDVLATNENQWNKEILLENGEFGIKFWRKDGGPLQIRHQDLAYIIDRESLDENGQLNKIVIYPAKVARYFKNRGFELVIVRDWILHSSLSLEPEKSVAYLIANKWEIESNIALMQAKIMSAQQLAFFGTHDIVDHLLNSDFSRFAHSQELFSDSFDVLSTVFSDINRKASNPLILSYLVGVLLDDLGQPRWYESQAHKTLVEAALGDLTAYKDLDLSKTDFDLPSSFHDLMQSLRTKGTQLGQVMQQYRIFRDDLREQKKDFEFVHPAISARQNFM